MTDTPSTAIEPATSAELPEPLARFHGALYATPDGGMHFAVRVDGEQADRHIQVPAQILRLAGVLHAGGDGGGGGLVGRLAGLFGKKGA